MNCCSNIECKNGIDNFFSKEAEKFLKRFKKRGLEKSQKNLVHGLQESSIGGKSILEIGCGVGALHAELIKLGASAATGVDISEEMIRLAKVYMKEIGFEKKTNYHKGDFVEISANVNSADITILDKVICCYPEVANLVEQSIRKTRQVYAFTLPRNIWWVKYPVIAGIRFLKLFRPAFHPYFHEHEIVNNRLTGNGFNKIYQNHTFMWETYVFKKKGF